MSASYENGCTPLIWECKLGHRWNAPPSRVKNGSRRKGSWCLECYNLRRTFHAKHSIEGMRNLAHTRGGKCLSIEYVDAKSKLLWQCVQGHRWTATPASVLQGTWCPACARNQRLRLSEFQTLAESRGGTCLSNTYANERTNLRWCCANGHQWNATPAKVKRGSWCPTCATICRRSRWVRRRPAKLIALERPATRIRSRDNRPRTGGHLFRTRVKVAK